LGRDAAAWLRMLGGRVPKKRQGAARTTVPAGAGIAADVPAGLSAATDTVAPAVMPVEVLGPPPAMPMGN
jgi:hypothetical protein